MALTSVFSLTSSFHLFSRISDTVASVPSLPSDFFSFPSSALFSSSMGAFPGLFSIRHPQPCTRFRSSFSVVSYSLVVPWCVTLRFWWTVPRFLLVYLCEVFLYEFIISLEHDLSTHFLKFFLKIFTLFYFVYYFLILLYIFANWLSI